MQNYDTLINGSIECSRGAQQHQYASGQDAQPALEGLRLGLNAVIAKVARLERQRQVRQSFHQAERELVELLRGEVADVFTVRITCTKGRWFVVTRSPGIAATAGTNTRGEGASFAEAWHDRSPLWS